MNVIVICKYLTFVGSAAQTFCTEWISFPAEHQTAELRVEAKSVSTANMTVQGQTSYDTDSEDNVGSAITVAAAGTQTILISSGLGPMFRVKLTATSATFVVLCIYLTPKVN